MSDNIKSLYEAIESLPARSAWSKGVKAYALEIIEGLDNMPNTESDILNGAENWQEYSEGGCALVYDGDIAERLCNPSELKKTRNGERNPNSRENWIDCQARALRQASRIIMQAVKRNK